MRFKGFERTRYLVGVIGLAAVAAVTVALLTVGGASGAATGTVLANFDTHGTYSWTVPPGVRKVIIDVYGAAGGNVTNGNTLISRGGLGGEALGTFAVKPGQTYEIVVGGKGGNPSGSTGGSPSFNGGGSGHDGSSLGGGGGGGGSDVRIGGSGNPCVSDVSCGYGDRIVVGGGGGGGGGNGGNGSAGGGLNGGGPADLGGTQEKGGRWSHTDCIVGEGKRFGCGEFGDGGFGVGDSAGGGGGGWYGGGASDNFGAGGGSGFVSHFARKGSFPGGFHGGDGLVVITIP